jgi:hypothetical protein
MKLYRERLHPAPSTFLYVGLVIPVSIIVFLPDSPKSQGSGLFIGIATGLALYAGLSALFVWTSPIVEVTSKTLRVGRAIIPRNRIGQVRRYDGRDTAEQRRTALDDRARLYIHGGTIPVLRVTTTDPQDPAPYWLVSTRNPDTLARLLDPRPSIQNEKSITQGEPS